MPVELPQWLQRLRRSEVVERVRHDPRSSGGTLLGVDREVAVHEVIGGGQAEFDQPWNDLSADDRVLLYAYFNQLGHLEELAEAFRMLFAEASRPESPIVVDLGCGPFTGGLAIATGLGHESRLDYIGVDRSRAMRELGEKLASAAAELDRTPRIDRHWSSDIASVTWGSAPGWRPVFVIVSYLLASPTLDAGELIGELEGLLAKLGRGPVTVLYTNSPRPEPNRSYPSFRTALLKAGFELSVEDTDSIEIERQPVPETEGFDTPCFIAGIRISFDSERSEVRLPTWDELQRVPEQRDVLEYRLDRSLFVVGPPGSGKTVLAIYRAQLAAALASDETGPSVAIVTFNRMLRRLLDMLKEADLRVGTMHSFVWHDYRNRMSRRPPTSAVRFVLV